MEHLKIPGPMKTRIPLFRGEWMELYNKMSEHPHAPKWNVECGDRLTDEDMNFVRQFALELKGRRTSFTAAPPEWLINWAAGKSKSVSWFGNTLPRENIHENWQAIKTMLRSDMQERLEQIVPGDVPLERLVVNPTSGTTGHPIQAPNHPCAVGCYDPMIQYVLERHGVRENYDSTKVAAIQVCSQKKTITYRTVHSYLDGAGFAKINLARENWKSPESAGIYINDMNPVFLSGDPFSFMEYMRLGISYRPKALLTTALSLGKKLRAEMEDYFQCPVADMYSLNETGPVAYSCPDDPSQFHILPHDLFVEILSPGGKQAAEGETGGIAVSGGRNPYLPLLRYMTGDSASIKYGACSCGEVTPALRGFQGRNPVIFTTPSGRVINSIDIAGVIREYPVYLFQFTQHRGYSTSLSISAGSDLTPGKEEKLKSAISLIFNDEVQVSIDREIKIDGGKNMPFMSEIN